MKIIAIVLSLFVGMAGVVAPKPVFSQNRDLTSCVNEVREERGSKCGNPKSTYVQLKNNCRQNAYGHICLQKANGAYDCRAIALSPGGTTDHYVCQGTGRTALGVCSSRGDCKCDASGNCYMR